MAQIDYLLLVKSLNEKHFNDAKAYLEDYLSFYFIKPSAADQNLIIEKMGQYLERVERNNAFIRDDDLPAIYVEQLIGMIENCAEPGSRAERYLTRAKEIQTSLKKTTKGDISSELDDITSIYLCLAQEYNSNSKKKIADFTFDIAKVDIKDILENIGIDNQYGLKALDMITSPVKKTVSVDANKKIQPIVKGLEIAQKSVSDFAGKLTQDNRKEPIHDVIEETNNEIYSKRSFAKVILILMYYRLMDINGLDS